METNFYAGKKVLVTGGAGFIGSHVVELLVARGARVTIPVRSERSNVSFLAAVKTDVNIVYADLLDSTACNRVMVGQDIVMNLAARVGGIEYNIKHPGSIFRENLTVFMNVLEAARQANVERFLVTSSACVYARHCAIPTPETEGFVGTPEPTNEGYGWSKRMEEFLGDAYHREHGMTIAIARPYNAYGPRDNFKPESSHVIPALIKRVIDGENPLVVWGDGSQSRSFLYVTDFARGLLAVCEHYAVSDVLNIGADEETTIKELIELIVRLTGVKVDIQFDVSKPAGQPRRHCDATKAKATIGFEAQVSLEEGLRQTIEWYRSNK
ncbi:MAG: NAD-dependent epimerase/dehydratase family protein [Candidatus Kerfeldbacteria bacterium]|nr:NAD-dependent epimerase/dehydratase family protein [Candidatus Kerfeldbacteria bacterium]